MARLDGGGRGRGRRIGNRTDRRARTNRSCGIPGGARASRSDFGGKNLPENTRTYGKHACRCDLVGAPLVGFPSRTESRYCPVIIERRDEGCREGATLSSPFSTGRRVPSAIAHARWRLDTAGTVRHFVASSACPTCGRRLGVSRDDSGGQGRSYGDYGAFRRRVKNVIFAHRFSDGVRLKIVFSVIFFF